MLLIINVFFVHSFVCLSVCLSVVEILKISQENEIEFLFGTISRQLEKCEPKEGGPNVVKELLNFFFFH